ncbi:photosystem I assembly protein Ycf3 [Bacteroidales bacterium Barb4]|nr:photosystem I assembly protein Ycf3 [Bacteroidales bacterium Barb4]
MGNAYNNSGKSETAIVCYQKAIDINPEFAEAYHNMGAAYKNLGDYNKYEECIKKRDKLISE